MLNSGSYYKYTTDQMMLISTSDSINSIHLLKFQIIYCLLSYVIHFISLGVEVKCCITGQWLRVQNHNVHELSFYHACFKIEYQNKRKTVNSVLIINLL